MQDPVDAARETTASCHSCGKKTKSVGRWSPVLRSGQVVGYTCPSCPRSGTAGEPIRRIENKGSVRFRVTLDLGDDTQGRRRQETKSFTTLAEARTHVRTRGGQIKAARQAGQQLTGRDETTINDLCDRWLEAKRGEVRDVTWETYSHTLKHVRCFLGSKRVQSVTRSDVIAFRTWLGRDAGRVGTPLSDHSTSAALTRLKAVLDYAVHVERLVPENVAKSVRPSRTAAKGDGDLLERWTAAEMTTFISHADRDRLSAAWRLSSLGLRREEVLGLMWADIDFDAGTISIRQSRVAVSSATDSQRWMIGPPKSAASRRTIKPDSVQPGTMAALRRLKLASVESGQDNPDSLVVVDEAGRPVKPRWYTDRFTALATEAGVPRIKLHSTRHSVAYLLHDAGVPPVKAAAFLGHTLAVHLSVYLFAREDDVEVAALALGAALRGASAGA